LRTDPEVAGCLYLAKRRGFLANNDFERIYRLCEELFVMINLFRKKPGSFQPTSGPPVFRTPLYYINSLISCINLNAILFAFDSKSLSA